MPPLNANSLPQWMLLTVLVARIGMAIYAVGLVRSKHATSTATRSLLDVCVVVLSLSVIGMIFLCDPTNGVFSPHLRADLGLGFASTPPASFRPVGVVAVLLASAILPGALAERCTLGAGLIASAVLAGIVVPIALLWVRVDTWPNETVGWLARHGVGSVGPVAALVGAAFVVAGVWRVGARDGKYHRDGSASLIAGHNLPLTIIGAFVLAVGLSANYLATSGAELALASAGLVALGMTRYRLGRVDVGLILTAVIGAALAVNMGPMLRPWESLVIGIGAGFIVPHVAIMAEFRWRVDDPTSAVAIWFAGGAWGTLAAGGFLQPEYHGFKETLVALLWRAIAIVVLTAWGWLTGWLTFAAITRFGQLRSKTADQIDGLDIAEHDVSAYPDFQQNSIR